MNIRTLFLGGAAALLFSIGVNGCNENPAGTNNTAPAPPTGLMANSASSSSVNLKWTAAADTGITGYTVSYKGADSGSMDVAGTSTLVTNLKAGAYQFSVVSKRGTLVSTAATVTWAGAGRATTDPVASTTLRMYEFSSPKESAMQIYNLTTGLLDAQRKSFSASKNPNLKTCQLAVFISNDTLEIGPAYAFDGTYQNANQADNTVFISDSIYYSTGSLDGLFTPKSLDNYVTKANGNTLGYTINATNTASAPGAVFFLRTGTAPNYHYAKVLVKRGSNNSLIQQENTTDKRFVEIEVSYQNTPGVPYAKMVPGATAPVSFGAAGKLNRLAIPVLK